MPSRNNRKSLKDCFLNRKIAVSVLVAVFVMVGLASPAIAQASSDAVLILHFDEGSGTIAKDSSGSGNDGTIYGATWVSGKYGKALSFDGVDDYVDTTLNPANDIGDGNPFSIEVWINLTGYAGDSYVTLVSADEGTERFYFRIKSNNNPFIGLGDGHNETSGVPITLNTWQHCVVTYDGSNAKVYVNAGAPWDSGNIGSKNFGSANTRIGRSVTDSREFNGIIDEVKVYTRALPAEEIKAHYEGKKPALTLTKSASPSTIQERETTTISIRVENTGTGDAKAIEVTDTIPTGFKIISGSKSASFDEIKAGDYRTSEYTLKATGSGKFTCDPATATYKDADGNSYSDASNSVSIQVGGEAPVSADSDGDGWSDEKEKEMGTNPYSVDSDGDGLKDPEDPNPTVPEEKKTPGFEVVFAIVGILAVAYLLRRKR